MINPMTNLELKAIENTYKYTEAHTQEAGFVAGEMNGEQKTIENTGTSGAVQLNDARETLSNEGYVILYDAHSHPLSRAELRNIAENKEGEYLAQSAHNSTLKVDIALFEKRSEGYNKAGYGIILGLGYTFILMNKKGSEMNSTERTIGFYNGAGLIADLMKLSQFLKTNAAS